jgi:hypothetical protein
MCAGAIRRVALLGQAGLMLATGGWLASCSGTHEHVHLTTMTPHVRPAAPTANVPALLGASIDGLRDRLGPGQPVPVGLINPLELFGDRAGAEKQDSLLSFQTGGLTLLANYDVRTRQVRDLLLLGRHEDSLMARAALRSSATNYLVMPVFRPDKPNHLLGLRVVYISH